MRQILAAVGAVVALAAITTGVVFALNYEGEDFCQDSPAWPGGTYLGQMHPYHSDFYRGYAERRGWDPCTTWATDQRNSAIRGLRELGYSVTEPGAAPAVQAPAPQATPEATPTPIAQHPDYQRVYDEAIRRGATPEQASDIAASVVSRGTVDAFMDGNDAGVIFGDVSPQPTPSPTARPPASQPANTVRCHSSSYRVGDSSYGTTELLWKATITNSTSSEQTVYIEVEWLDGSGFQLDWNNEIVDVSAHSSYTVSDNSYIDDDDVGDIRSFRISDCNVF